MPTLATQSWYLAEKKASPNSQTANHSSMDPQQQVRYDEEDEAGSVLLNGGDV